MKKALLIGLSLLLIGGIAVYFFLFKKSNDHLVLIPKNSFVVIAADLKTLAQKANVTEWKNLYMFKKLDESNKENAEKSRFIKDAFSNPLTMGIDPVSDLYFFFEYTQQFQPIFGVAFAVRSTTDLENILKKMPLDKGEEVKHEIESKEGYKQFHLSKDALIAWKDGAGIFATGFKEEELDKWVGQIMKQDKKTSLADNNYFIEFTKMKQDIGAFVNYEGVFNSPAMGMLTASIPGNPYLNSFKTSSASISMIFENEKIAMSSVYNNSNAEAMEKYSFISGRNLDDVTLKSLTTKKPFAFYGFTFDPDKIFSILESDANIGKQFDAAAGSIGLTKEEVKGLLGGDIAFSLNDFTMLPSIRKSYDWNEKTNETIETVVPDTVLTPEFSVAVSIKDKNSLHKLLEKFGLTKDSAGYYSLNTGNAIYYFIENNTGVTITNGKTVATELATQKQYPSILEGKAGELAKSAPAVFYGNLVLDEYPEVVKTSMRNTMQEDNYKLFSDFVSMFTFMDGKFTNKKGEMNINMNTSEDNSLWRIIKQSDVVAKKLDEDSKKRAAKYDEEMVKIKHAADSLAALEIQGK